MATRTISLLGMICRWINLPFTHQPHESERKQHAEGHGFIVRLICWIATTCSVLVCSPTMIKSNSTWPESSRSKTDRKNMMIVFSTVQKKQDLPYTNRNRIKLNGLVLLKNLNWKPSKFSHLFAWGFPVKIFPTQATCSLGSTSGSWIQVAWRRR